MRKAKQEANQTITPEVSKNGKTPTYGRARTAALDGLRTTTQRVALAEAICMDHAEQAAELDPELLLKSLGKIQNELSLAVKAAAEARRNPQFKSSYFLTA